MNNLVYDIGMHDGADSAFYLAKGFRVVAVEADPELCAQAAQRFAAEIADGRLVIVNRAIVEEAGAVTLYRSKISGWATVVEACNRENIARGVAADSVVVDGITLADLVDEHGDAYFMKLDIEGMDRTALEALAATDVRPGYLSMESSLAHAPTMASIRADFAILTRLGYDRFKIVDQAAVPVQVPPSPARAGVYVAHTFSDNSSGLFGEEAPGEWQPEKGALESFREIYGKNWLSLLLYRNIRIFIYYSRIMNRLTDTSKNLNWYDIHAKHSSLA